MRAKIARRVISVFPNEDDTIALDRVRRRMLHGQYGSVQGCQVQRTDGVVETHTPEGMRAEAHYEMELTVRNVARKMLHPKGGYEMAWPGQEIPSRHKVADVVWDAKLGALQFWVTGDE